ncbi:hypothetical protein ACFLYD_00470 [Chloroflexota bacterium]
MKDSIGLSVVRGTAWQIVAIGLAVSQVTAACAGGAGESGTVADEITVTFDGDKCTYDGSGRVAAGQVTVILDVEDQKDYDEYGLAVLTLDEDKTLEDLDAWPSTDQPPWTQLLGLVDEIAQGSRDEMTIIALEKPLFLVCFTAYPVAKSGVLGPVDVVE